MTDKARQALEALKKKYIESLPEKINELKSAWEQCVISKKSLDIETAYRGAHSMSGSGATFGQVELGKAAKSLELYIKEQNESGNLFLDKNVIEINSRIDSLYELIHVADGATESGIAELNVSPTRSMEIMIVDDDEDMRQQLTIFLERLGHRVVHAADGKTALKVFESNTPELVLMDVVMPDMDGVEATKLIRNFSGRGFVPIIFITSLNDAHRLAGLIEAGGDDFLVKPIDPVILSAKINAFARIVDMYQQLNVYRRETEDELETSKHLLNTLLNMDVSDVHGLNSWAASPGHFSGDLRLVKKRDNGEVLILLCDFTGHGLPAAIGTIFVADLFRSMTKKAFEARIILNEINEKMNQILPTGRYCAATMISYKTNENLIEVWNCGLPTLYLLDENHKIAQRVESNHVPLGVLKGELSIKPEQFCANDYSSIVVFSDGITEAENNANEMYSEDRLIASIESVPKGASVFQQVKSEVESFIDGAPLADDISFVVLDL